MRTSLKAMVIWGLAGTVAAASSCSSLPDLELGVCGNGVVEPNDGEDCDDGITDDAGHQTCYPAGSIAACHFDCSTSACPPGFSCGNDAVCRKPSGIFKDTGHATQIDADHLFAGDFDHDGLGDVVAQTAVQMNVLFGDSTGALSDPFTIRATNATPAVGLLALDPDGGAASEPYSDLVFSALDGVTTWRGRQDRTLAPTPYPSLQLGSQEARVIEAKVLDATQDILVYANAPGDTNTALLAVVLSGQAPDFRNIFLKLTGPDFAPSALVGDFAVANLNTTPASPCDELAFAFGSVSRDDRVSVLTTCTSPLTTNSFDDESAAVAPPIPPLDVLLPLDVKIRSNGVGVRTGDIDGDGNLDLFVDAQVATLLDAGTGSTPATYVAYGLGDGTFSSSPTHVPIDNRFSHLFDAQLLAAGQLTFASDSFPDFVFANGIVLQVAAPDDAGAKSNFLAPVVPDQAWADARIADLDGDGFPDMVGGSAARVDIYRASSISGLVNLTPVHYAVDGNASEFAIGDFDGDRVSDIALRGDHGNNAADLDVMWGKLFGAPDDPFTVGRFGNIRSIGTGVIASVLGNDDSVGDLGVVVEGTDGSFTVSVLAGSTDRQLQAPFFMQQQVAGGGNGDTTLAAPLGFSVGQLTTGDRHADIVAGTAVSRGDAGTVSLRDAGPPTDIELAIAQSTGAAQLSSDPSLLKFSNRLDTFGASAACTTGIGCNLPIANWNQLSLVTADLDGQLDGGAPGNGVDEIIGIAPALATGIATIDRAAVGQIFWARFDGSSWKVQTTGLGVIPAKGATPLAALAAADVNGDGNTDVLALISNANLNSQTTLLAYINTASGQLPTKTTVISLPAYASDPGAPFQIVAIAPIDADAQPGKEIAMLTDAGGLFLAKSNAAGDVFTVIGPLCENAALSACVNSPSLRIPAGQAIAAIDVDGDGIQDLVIESSLTLRVYKGLAVDP